MGLLVEHHPGKDSGSRRTPALPFVLRSLWLVILGYGMQAVAVHAIPATASGQDWEARLISLSVIPLLAWVWLNRRLWGVLLIGLGLCLNLAVMLANGGFMPIEPGTIASAGMSWQLATATIGHTLPHSKDILLNAGAIRIAPLRDWIIMNRFPWIGRILSPGDLVVVLGLLVTLAETVRVLWTDSRRGDAAQPLVSNR